MNKSILSVFLIFISVSLFSQNINDILPKFNKKGMETDILYNPAGVGNIEKINDKKQNLYDFYQVYKSISFSDFKQRYNELEKIKKNVKNTTLTNKVNFGIIYTEYDTFIPDLDMEKTLRKTKKNTFKLKRNNKQIFDKKELFVTAALKQIQRGTKIDFEIGEETFINTTDKKITKIEIDFGDDYGFRDVSIGETVKVHYKLPGKKEITTRLFFFDGSKNDSFSSLEVVYSNEEFSQMNNQEIVGFTSETTAPPYIQPYNEYPFKGWGEMSIFHSSDGILDKPIFLIDGFDPSDSRNIEAIYAQLNYSGGNLGDQVRSQGYDVVVLNFPTYFREEDQVWIYGGADYIERNAMLLVELIKSINNSKVGNEKNIVIGPSMGGLVSRYALNYMESNNIDHDTRLYMSFDAPHMGANVPIGFQHMFNFLAYGLDTWVGDFSVEALRPLVDGMLKSPAARQMLWDHFEPHLQSGSSDFDNENALPQSHSFYNIFYDALDNVGLEEYPVNTRNVAIINGSGNLSKFNFKNGNPVNPGDQVLDAFLPEVASGTDAYLDSWYTPDINVTSTVSKVYVDAPWICFCDITSEALSRSHGHTAGPDTVPGGLFNIEELAASFAVSDPLVATFINELQTNYFTFIPSISGMDYFTNNWNDYMGNPDNTPFDAWSMPSQNEEHVKLTPQNVEFALNEIYNGESSNNGNIITDQNKKSALVFRENSDQGVVSGIIYRSASQGQASRSGNGDNNSVFGYIGDWSVDLTVSEKSPSEAANDFGAFKDNQHPLYQGSDILTQNHDAMGSIGWGSFTANAYNRSSGTGSVAMGFNNIAGTFSGNGPFILDATNNVGQTVFGHGSRALGNVSFAAGFRNTAFGNKSVVMGNFNYATGDSSVAIGKTNYAEGLNSIAIGFKSHAAGDRSVALGQENVSWGTTNFTAGYQNIAGDRSEVVGSGGSAIAMGFKNIASSETSAAFNKHTKAMNQAATSIGFGTTADNLGMLAIGVNNYASIGNSAAEQYYYTDGAVNGSPIGVAFVIGNGDINTQTNTVGANPSNAFVVKYDGSANLSGGLNIESDERLKSNITSLGSTVAKLMQIDGKSYTLKSNEKENKIGLLAQEILEVFPELVKSGMDKNETLSVNYQGLIPVLINAIKEQQNQIDELMVRIKLKRQSENGTE
jgi:hypothetical protein